MTSPSVSPRASKPWAVWIALLVPAILIATVAAVSVVGNRSRENVLYPQGPPAAMIAVSDTFRQGWGFFTRDAREDRSDLFRDVNGQWQRFETGVMSSAPNFFGLTRTQRAYMADVAFIVSELDEGGWKECGAVTSTAEISECASSSAEHRMEMEPIPQIPCAEPLLVTKERPIPFVYAGLTQQRQTQIQVIRIDCH